MNTPAPVQKMIIAGGGTAGWMTAALTKKVLGDRIAVELVESEQIGIIGVGEATIPPIQTYNGALALDEREFLKATHATIKLAIRFEGWRKQGESYFHTFGAPGTQMGFCSFQHFLARAQKLGERSNIWDYDLNYLCCAGEQFNKINTQNPLFELRYAYHLDSTQYGQYLRKYSEDRGVLRTEGIITGVTTDSSNGFVQSLQLEDGRAISGDIFVDCTGLRGLLIRQTLGVEYEDWSHWLPADRAIAVQTKGLDTIRPYTRSIAHACGWQWQIPLTHRIGNGIVYSSNYLSDEEAEQALMNNLPAEPVNDPRVIPFQTGRTKRQWHRNVVAVGLSSGFLEPLESTSIHLIQSAVARLLKLFPHDGISPAVAELYNRESKDEFETIRDFIILHYHVNERDDSDFWRDMRTMSVPERLQNKIEVFRETSSIFAETIDIFRDASWLQVMMGQGIIPADYHPAANTMPEQKLFATLKKIRKAKQQPLAKMMPHKDFLERYLAS